MEIYVQLVTRYRFLYDFYIEFNLSHFRLSILLIENMMYRFYIFIYTLWSKVDLVYVAITEISRWNEQDLGFVYEVEK